MDPARNKITIIFTKLSCKNDSKSKDGFGALLGKH